MSKTMSVALLAGASCLAAGLHQAEAIETSPLSDPALIYADRPTQRPAAPVRTVYAGRSNMGGGLIEFLFGDGQAQGGRYQQQPYQQQPSYEQVMRRPEVAGAYPGFDPRFEKQLVDYHGSEKPGTIIIDTPNKFLFLVQGNGTAVHYGVGVGRPGFTWSG